MLRSICWHVDLGLKSKFVENGKIQIRHKALSDIMDDHKLSE